jgi:hypothetical protein
MVELRRKLRRVLFIRYGFSIPTVLSNPSH